MSHLELEELALAALGEPMTDAASAHLATCAQCDQELQSLSATVATGRAAGPEPLDAPPARVWDAVSAELGLPAHVQPGAPAPATAPEAAAAPDAAPVDELTSRRALRSSRRASRGAPWLAVAAAAGVVVGGLGVGWWNGRTPTPAVIEAAALDALPDWAGASGEAVVEVADDGTRRLVVTLSGAADQTGYHEVWLIDTEVTKLVSLGVLAGREGSFILPEGLDLEEYPVVDVSEEQFDGDPTHSGDSIVRGILGT